MVKELQIIGSLMLVSIIILLISFVKDILTLQMFSLGYLLGLISYEIILYFMLNE